MLQFSGDIRDYPRFKSDFQKQVEPTMGGDQEAAYVLKCCLSNVALEIIHNVDDDLKEMWQQLDEEYRRPSGLIDVVVNDINRLRSVHEEDARKLLHIIDTVE